MTWKGTVLYASTMTASALGTSNLYLDFSKFVIGPYSSGTSTTVKSEFSVLLAVCILGLGFSFKKTLENLVELLDNNL